ncbi:MAG: hypothetical protein HFI63_01490 [Lachnospiraceae bacterium]|nr:hypothetical protein [Lachnospiraceae bacterium]
MNGTGMLKSDLNRLFHGKRLYISILLVFGIAFLGLVPEIRAAGGSVSVYYLINARHGLGAFFVAMTTIVALPFGLGYAEDVKYNYIHCLHSRQGLYIYGTAHILTTAIGGFLTVFVGYLLFYGGALLKFPLCDSHDMEMLAELVLVGGASVYERLLLSEFPISYLICVCATEAMGYSFLATLTVAASTRVKNIFIILSVPLIFHYGSTLLCEMLELPGVFRWYYVLSSGGFLANLNLNIWRTMLFVFLYFFSFICIVGVVFISGMEKKYKNG